MRGTPNDYLAALSYQKGVALMLDDKLLLSGNTMKILISLCHIEFAIIFEE